MNSKLTRSILLVLGMTVAGMSVQAQSLRSPPTVTAAVKAHDLTGVNALLKKGADVNAVDVDGTTPLMLAVQERDADMIQTLLKAGAEVDTANRYGATALHTAARNGDTRSAILLLNAGANPGTALPEGETVLMAASRTGNVELVNALLAGSKNSAGETVSKADPNFKESWKGQTALMWAAAEGHADAIRALVAGGARVDEFSTQIEVPEVNPDRRVGGFVYAKIPKGRMAAIHFAARGGHLDAVNALVQSGANVNIVDADGSNAMIIATINGHPDIAVSLLEAGADPNIADNYGRTILFEATDMNTLDANPRPAPLASGEKTYVDVVKLALAKGADPNARLKTALPSWVAQGGEHNPILREGATAFLRASLSGDLEVIRLLLDAKADTTLVTAGEKLKPYADGGPNRDNYGQTNALQAAAGVGWREEVSRGRDQDAIETIKLLLARGADVNAANGAGNTPLHGAALRGSPAIVEFLLKQGADPTVKNARGLTPVDIAMGVPEFRIMLNQAVVNVFRQNAPAKLSSNR